LAGAHARRRWLLALGVAGALVVASVLAIVLLFRGSLAQLDGREMIAGISAPVLIERDALGVPTLSAASRDDLAFATGFVHAQDRFFQMDLSRRLAAGELAELVGSAAVPLDRRARLYRFRNVARQSLAGAPAGERALLAAYTRGVNAGLLHLASRPWEYWLLGSPPAAWRDEDSVLVGYAMWWDLQQGDVHEEQLRERLAARVNASVLRFLYPERTSWDSPNVSTLEELRAQDAGAAALADLPAITDLDVRGAAQHESVRVPEDAARVIAADSSDVPRLDSLSDAGRSDIGSNNWALAGRLTATGAALVASDMHLGLRLPTTWYHARLRVVPPAAGKPRSAPADARLGASPAVTPPLHATALDLNGVTLPGEPLLIAGSNGSIAWAFTNSAGHWLEVRPLSCSGVDQRGMLSAAGAVPLASTREIIHVRHAADEVLEVRSGPSGVLLDVEPETGRCWFVSWLALVPAATNLSLQRLESATSAREALDLAPEIGIPHQNLVVGDREGHIGWAIAGRVPVSTAPGRAIAGAPWRTRSDAPQLFDPPIGRLWTANARATSDPEALAAIGAEAAVLGAQYDLGARARQIRDALLGQSAPATPREMLHIQLDDRALFLARWRDLMLTLTASPAGGSGTAPGEGPATSAVLRAEAHRLLASWDGRAAVDSAGYRLTRAYRDRTAHAVWQMLLASAGVTSSDPPPPRFEQPLWTLITRQPLYLLAPRYASWRQLLLAQLDATAAELASQCGTLDHCRWGAAHPVMIRHPLSAAVPWLGWLIDLKRLELPGDHDMPRVQDGAFGASERFAISPGHEAEAYLHLPGGASGHPLSPYYRAGFAAWARGEPTPLLPGRAQHRLTFQPEAGL
jgi:penicillin G amidase